MALLARLLVIFALAVAAAPASAQGWFGNFFGGGAPSPRQGAPAYPGYGGGGYGGYRGGYGGGGYGGGYGGYGYAPQRSDNDYYRPPPRHHAQKRKPIPDEDASQEAAKAAPAPPKNASLFVYVFGDSLGQMLADGLDDALADRDDVAVIHKAKGSTGLVASDFYDWPKAVDDLLAGREGRDAGKDQDAAQDATKDASKSATKGATKAPKIDVAVMMIGSNDKQAIREGGKTLAFGTPDWTAAYTKRVAAIDEAFKAHGIPLIWVGVPITKDDGFADAMASLNDITRDAAAKSGATFVDTWEAFSDDDGDFSTYGPDINGQTVRLRAADGIHFTKAGARKLAHFVEAHVRRALDGKTPVPQLPTGEASSAKPAAAVKPDAGPIRNLVEAPEAKGGALASLPGKAGDGKSGSEPATTLARGEATPVPAGRADDARWPPKGAPEP